MSIFNLFRRRGSAPLARERLQILLSHERGAGRQPDLLAILRCPLNPSKTRLVLDGDQLVCERCVLKFKIKDGFPVLVAEEAELPPGCDNLNQLPCQLESRKSF